MAIIEKDVVIVGAGIGGLATAVALKRVGIEALVLERSDGLRTTGAALSLFPDAWIALDALGVSDKLKSIYTPFTKTYVTDIKTGAVQETHFSQATGNGPISVHRKNLLEVLAVELSSNAIRFSSKVISLETQTEGGSTVAILCLGDGTTIKAKVLIGCDGVHSVIARWLGLADPVNSGRSAVRGLAVYPEGHGHKEVQQFVDVGKRAGFVPLNDKELYWFLTTDSATQGEVFTDDPEQIQRDVIEKYAKDFPPLYLDVVRHADLSSVTWTPLVFRYPWNVLLKNLSRGNITVLGDAMHPMTPDLGHGGGATLEDAVVLGQKFGNLVVQNKSLSEENVTQALEEYVKERRWRAATLITGSYLSGWVQQSGDSWFRKLFRYVFYRFLLTKVTKFIHYDCGKLPTPQLYSAQENSIKTD